MNSEITNVSKLVPATVVKSDRQNEKIVPLKSGSVTEQKIESVSVLSTNSGREREPGSSLTSQEKIKSAMATGNAMFQADSRSLEFQLDDSTKKIVIKIVDSKTGETVRQIPSEDMLAFIKKMQELDGQKGSVIQNRA